MKRLKGASFLFAIIVGMAAVHADPPTVTDPSANDPAYDQAKAQLASPLPDFKDNTGTQANRTSGNSAQNAVSLNVSGTGETNITQLAACWIPVDGTYSSFAGNDDGSIGPIALPFTFELYGTNYTSVYINNNGNLTFLGPFGGFTAAGFPLAGNPMVAPFWADVDTRAGNIVRYKVFPTRLVVTWESVGYYSIHTDKLNTFQVVIGTNNDPVIGLGQNVAFFYGDMQWTTGDASSGSGGFAGVPATVGINEGNGIDYIQVGRFNSNTSGYDGPGGADDGISYLDDQCMYFDVNNAGNIPPTASTKPAGNTVNITCGQTVNFPVTFIAPEVNQTVSTVVNTGGLCNATFTSTSGATSTTSFTITGAPCNEGTHTISLTATDNGSPAESVTEVITIIVSNCNQPPVAACQNVTVNADANCQGTATAAQVDNGSSDPDLDALSFSLSPAGPFALGNTPVTLTVSDGSLSSSCNATILVVDATPPTISCPADVTVPNAPGLCGSVVTYLVNSTDNCAGQTVAQTAGLPSESIFPVGTTTNSFTVTDASGNTDICSFTVTVNDTEVPTISCPANITVSNDVGVCGAAVDFTVNASDNCPGVVLTQTGGSASGSSFPVGTTTNSFLATDAVGLTAACYFTVTVNDVQPPVFTTGKIAVIDRGFCNFTVKVKNAQLAGASGVLVVQNVVGPPVGMGGLDPSISIPVMMISMADAVPIKAILGGPAPVHINMNSNTGVQVISPYAADLLSTSAAFGPANYDLTGELSYALDNALIHLGCSGYQPGTFVTPGCPPDMMLHTDLNMCGTATFYTIGSSDNCEGQTLLQIAGQPSGSVFPIGTTTNSFVVTDASGLIATCSFDVTVEDHEAPIAICQDVTVQLDAAGNGSTTAEAVNNGSTDNCGILAQCGPQPPNVVCTSGLELDITDFTCANVGANPVLLSVNDVHGNSSTCNAIVVVEDHVDPVALCQNLVTALDANGSASITAAQIDNGSNDACGIFSLSVTPSTFNCTNTGDNTVTLTVTDVNDNSSTCTATVTVTGGPLFGYVMIANEEVHLHKSNVQSGGVGVMNLNGKAVFHDNTTVTAPGTFVQSPVIVTDNTSAVAVPLIGAATPPLPSFETNPYTSNNDITVASGQTVTLADSIYNKVKVEKFGTVIFSSPVVNIRHLDAKEFTVIRFAQCAIVRMKEHMHIKRNSKFNPDELDVTVFAQKHVDIKEGSVVFATIYAKDEHIHAKGKGNNRTAMTGLFIGKKIHKGEYVDWNANKQCGRCLASPELFGRVIASTDVSCDGASNGSLTLDVTGGTPPYDISWNTIPAQSGATASNLAPGSYVATITDWLGATTTVNTDIIVFGYTILAKDEVKLGKHDSVYTGSVGVTSVAGKIEIGEQSGVVDDDAMVIAPVLNIHATSTVTDEEYGVAAAVLSAFEAVPYVSSTDINVPNGATVTLTPVDTLKRKIVVGENATLIISAGVLNLTDRLELKKNATVRFTQACSKVRIKVDLKTDDNATINSEGKQVTFHVGANVEFKKGSKVSATIYAPNGTIKTEHAAAAAPTIMTGKFIGKKVEGGDYTYWHQRTLCPCISTSGGPVFLANTPGTNNDASGALDKSVSSSIKVNAYPNPFRDQVTISFTSPVADKVRLVVLNPVGSEVEELYDGPVNAEQEYQFRFNAGSTNSSGIYFYRIQTGGGNTVVNKIILTK